MAVAGLPLVGPLAARADVYTFTDADGVAHFTNAPDSGLYQNISRLLDEPGMRTRAGAAALPANVAVFAPHIDAAAAEAGVDPALVHAVITAESGYNPTAVSRAGARGLMQLMPETARRYAVRDVFDPRQNIRGGTRYLRDLLDLFGNDVALAVAAYNAGENAVVRAGMQIPAYRETRLYVPKVLRLYQRYRTLM
jgi:soluble lytic murein transglycosylase-like protein